MPFALLRYAEPLVLVQLPAGADVPDWVDGRTLVSVTATPTQTSVLCSALNAPGDLPQIGPFVAFEIDQDLDPSHSGLIAELSQPLADAGISLLPVAVYLRGWILVQSADARRAMGLWRDAGFEVRDAVEEGS